MTKNLLSKIATLTEDELRRELTEILTRQKLGLVWEHSAIERDRAANQDVVLPRLDARLSHGLDDGPCQNLIIEGDNFDSLRLLRATHTNKIRVIYIDPPYNTGNKDWVYNDHYVGKNDRWRHSQWLEFLYQRLVLARDLLTPDGIILVSINDENRSRLELLMDEVFPRMRVGSLVWRKRRPSNAAGVDRFYSEDHEHVLAYSNSDFSFNGSEKTWSGYSNWDDKKQDWWATDNLTLGFTGKERKNLFFPLHNPKTDIWYPCDWNRVWCYASKLRLGDREVRTRPMEEWIEDDCVYFPPEVAPATYHSVQELKAAIKSGVAPQFLDKADDMEFWLGKKIGYNKPRFKRFKKNLRNSNQPLSSWIDESGKNRTRTEEDPAAVTLETGMSSEGTKALRAMGLDDAFPYPKPISLLRGLLSQATRPGDIVLDFFAGSGTTAHAVLELNSEDDGGRRFILCSSTEATENEPSKNICRDITSERIRRAMTGYGKAAGFGGQFAYLTLEKFHPADAEFDATPASIRQLLSLKLSGVVLPDSGNRKAVDVIASTPDAAALYIPKVTQAAIEEAMQLKQLRLLVFSDRPETARELLTAAGKTCDSRPIGQEIAAGQAGAAATQFAPQEAK